MKKSAEKLLETLNSGKKLSNRVHQSTIAYCVLNNWIEFSDKEGWELTDAGYLAYLRG